MSQTVSNGSWSRSAATSPTVRPDRPSFSGANVSAMVRCFQFAMPRSGPAAGELAPSFSRRRSSGSDSTFIFSAGGRAIVSRQPGRASRMNPVRRLSRKRMRSGTVRATTRAPFAAA